MAKVLKTVTEKSIATITYKYAGQIIVVTGKVAGGIFRVGISYVK